MNREDIIRMAREAALPTFIVDSSLIMAFCMAIARKSASAEREECAKVCDGFNSRTWLEHRFNMADAIAEDIRARGEE